MRIDVISIFPQMFTALTDYGIPHQALKKSVFDFHCWNPRDFSDDKHQRVDDRPYGGGPGMVMMAPPLARCADAVFADIKKASSSHPVKFIYLSPQGQSFNQSKAEQLADSDGFVLLCGRYEGVDERFINEYVDEELSLGDFVLAGGEFAAMAVIESVVRLLPEALGNEVSAHEDSFSNELLDWPHYTRPEEFAGQRVPDVLLSGNHAKIHAWRSEQALQRTAKRRPDLLKKIQKDQNND